MLKRFCAYMEKMGRRFFWYLIFASCLLLVTSSKIECGEGYYFCDSGDECVRRNDWCNEKIDCEDKSDEAYCYPATWWNYDPNGCGKKSDTHFHCDSGICLPLSVQCDGHKDCKDGDDEKFCTATASTTVNMETSETEDKSSAEDYSTTADEEYYTSEEEVTSKELPSTVSIASTSRASNPLTEDEEKQTTSTKREIYSNNRINSYLPKSTSFYQGRMKEAGSETKPTFPKTVPTRPSIFTRSTVPTTHKIYTRSSTRATTSTSTRSVEEKRPIVFTTLPQTRSTRPPRHDAQQRQTANRQTIHRQSPINHYQLPSNIHQPPSNHYQPSSNRYQPPSHPTSSRYPTHYQQPSNNYQPSSNNYQPTSNRYQPTSNYYQPSSSNRYQHPSPPNHYQQPSNHNQRRTDHQEPTSYTNYNEHRPLNGEPDVRYQTNYFKPYSAEQDARRLFYFAKDYAATYGRDNARSVSDAAEWILRRRTGTADWGRDTPRAVIALALANNSFLSSNDGNEIIKKRFMIQLGADLLRNNTVNFNINRLAMAINGLLAVCEDPTDFHGIDLTETLRYKIRDKTRSNSYVTPFVYLSLCLSNKSLSSSEVRNLMKQMTNSAIRNDRAKDMLSAAIMAFSCHLHQSTSEDPYRRNITAPLRGILRDAVDRLLEQIGDDGNFGSVYSTALAAQALISTNETSNWNAGDTMRFLREQQREDGSFGDLLSTYLVIPALSGRSLLHLRNIPCITNKRELTPAEIKEFVGPKQYVHYSLYFGYPLVNSQSLFLLVPKGINFLDVMRVAEYQNQNFRFSLENNSSKAYSLSGLPNDPEMGLSWHLYVKDQSSTYVHEPNINDRYAGDVRSLYPKSSGHLIFWYHSNELK